MTEFGNHCCLCGLMCPLRSEDAADGVGVSLCPKHAIWLETAEAIPVGGDRSLKWSVERLVGLLDTSGDDVLLWVEGADVATMRSVVDFAKQTGVTIHIPQSGGAAAAKRVMLNDGWMGTTLAEVSTHADLVVTLGDRSLTEAPLLPMRFFTDAIRGKSLNWWHISSQKELPISISDSPTPYRHLVWPRATWLERLTELQMEIHEPPVKNGDESSTRSTQAAGSLADALRNSQYSVWLWENSEFIDEMDELIIRRLLSLARQLTLERRCSLLNLESQIGQVTAEEVLLWLTGCSAAARWDGQSWNSPDLSKDRTADEWRARFSKIVLVRTTPALGPLPEFDADLFLVAGSTGSAPEDRVVSIETSGLDTLGHLFRGDRAVTLQVGRASNRSLPSAANIFLSALDKWTNSSKGSSHAN